jgi:hypothetical protein
MEIIMIRTKSFLFTAVLMPLLAAQTADAAFKCKGSNGVVEYRSTPCAVVGKSTEGQVYTPYMQGPEFDRSAPIAQEKMRRQTIRENAFYQQRDEERAQRRQQQQHAISTDLARESAANQHYAEGQQYRRQATEYNDQAAVSRANGWKSNEIYERNRAEEYDRRAKALGQ